MIADGGSIGDRLGGLSNKLRWLIAAIAGATAVAAMPPFYILPALFSSFTMLIWLIRAAPTRRAAFAIGFAFGLGYFVAGLYWIANAFSVVGGATALGGWPAVIGLSAYLALFPAAASTIYRAFDDGRDTFGVRHAITFAALWVVTEWCRGWVLTGFPWNPVGLAWANMTPMIQATSLFGVYGLGFVTVIVSAAFAGPWWQGHLSAGRWRLPALAIMLLALIGGSGAYRLAHAPAPGAANVPDVRLRLVQPDIPQRLKWVDELRPEHVRDQVALSRAPAASGKRPPNLVIWSETATPFYVNGDNALLRELGRAAPLDGYLITGGLRRTGTETDIKRFNSLFAVTPAGGIVATYDKEHLVPFGEYMPLDSVLPLRKLTAGAADFTPGSTFAPIKLDGFPPFQPLICYEAIFPGGVVAPDAPRPAWLLNLTNDAWYGISTGPHQHFAMVRLRAIEEGLPVVRVANTGISGVIDPYGRVRASLALGARGTIDADLPDALPETVFARTGNGLIMVVLLAWIGWQMMWRRRQNLAPA